MIKIDYQMIMRDYVWFGWMIDDYPIAQAGPIWFRLPGNWYRRRITRIRNHGKSLGQHGWPPVGNRQRP